MAGKLQSLTIESRLPPNLSKDIYVPSLIESRLNDTVIVTIRGSPTPTPIVRPFPLTLGGSPWAEAVWMVKRVARIAKKRGICFFIIVDLRGGNGLLCLIIIQATKI